MPSGASVLSPQLGVGGNLSVTGWTTAVLGQCPLLTRVESLQMFLTTEILFSPPIYNGPTSLAPMAPHPCTPTSLSLLPPHG